MVIELRSLINFHLNINGKLYNFNKLKTISAGDRDADAEGVEGMSASKMRKAAAENDFETFSKGVPNSLDDKTVKQLFNTVKKQMKIKEGWSMWEIAPKFVIGQNLTKKIMSQEIVFNVNQLVENLNTGLVGRVIRRGTNYLICVTEDGMMFKSWIRDLTEKKKGKTSIKNRNLWCTFKSKRGWNISTKRICTVYGAWSRRNNQL